MELPTKQYFYNNILQSGSYTEIANVKVAVYEVIKIIDGIPLFFDDHINRLNNSIELAHIERFIIEKSMFFSIINKLCSANNQWYGNVELRVSQLSNGEVHSFIGFIPHYYPSPIMYFEGVLTSLLVAERQSPNAKVKGTLTRSIADKQLNNSNLYEVLLVNKEGFITEGSRSNVFFIKGNLVYSAPLQYILPGITRKYALQALEAMDVVIVDMLFEANLLYTADAAFLCGTSPGILPIKQIDNVNFDVQNKILRNCMQGFNELVSNYLSKNV